MTSPRDRMTALRRSSLRTAHENGKAPQPDALDGRIDGMILTSPIVSRMGVWRGKVFTHQQDGTVGGLNRIGVGPLEFERYRFVAHVGPSAFGDRDVLLLDHDNDDNPRYIRRYHDELVQVEDGLFLATTHYRVGGRLRFLAYFALAYPLPDAAS